MEFHQGIRFTFALLVACGLAYHGKRKNSLNLSGSIAAVIVGFLSFSCSYRFGIILILFYYTSSKLTKVKEEVKEKLEDNYTTGGQRNYLQVFASSLLATGVAVTFFLLIGEDTNAEFGTHRSFAAYLWVAYVSHYATAAADTWASEIGILSRRSPRLITSLFLKEVPHGTNGGMSLLGTIASCAGGAFIGTLYWIMSYAVAPSPSPSQFPMVLIGLFAGFTGSLLDSLLGATLQVTYYSRDRKLIIKDLGRNTKDKSVVRICGVDLLSNEHVNMLSILLCMIITTYISPALFCLCDSDHCSRS